MQTDDLTLQELIVRALTSRDTSARKSLDRAAAHDPELQKFCAELDDLVAALSGAKDWRSETPSAELTQRIREAVVSKLPAAPPHFRSIVLDSDLGQSKASRSTALFLGIVAVLILGLVALSFTLKGGSSSARLTLKGEIVHESAWKNADGVALSKWKSNADMKWLHKPEGISPPPGDTMAALNFSDRQNAAQAVAFSVDVKVPELDEKSSISVVLDSPNYQTATTTLGEALELVILPDGLQLMGPGNTLLTARAVSNARGGYYRVRIEHLGGYARVTVNNDVYFDGPMARPLRGDLEARLFASGPKRSEVLFSNVRIEK